MATPEPAKEDVLLYISENDVESAAQEIKNLSGRITHRFGNQAIVVKFDTAPPDLDKLSHISTSQPADLDVSTTLAVNAWRNNLELRKTPRAPGVEEGAQWNSSGYQAPVHFDTEPKVGESFVEDEKDGAGDNEEGIQRSTGTPTSRYLTGSVAVGIVIVSRDQGSEEMTTQEQTTVVQQAQQGLDFLANAEPRANISFVYDIQPQTVTVSPGPVAGVPGAYERFERPWRDAALANMGFAAGRTGYRQYVTDLRTRMGTDWAFVAFFTKYQINHFAYAIYEKVVMHYDNDGWGTNNIHRVFAHETCHIFGAADEYGSCSCNSLHGELQERNGNCVACFPPGTQADCLMNQNTLVLCPFSQRQIGWDTTLFPQP